MGFCAACGGELRKMFLRQGRRHRRKGKRLYKGKCLKKQAKADANYEFETCLSLECLISSHFLFAIS
jgi:hypothetical protein